MTRSIKKLTIGVIDSWHRLAHEGSGTAVAVSGLCEALQRSGHSVLSFSPENPSRFLTLSRLLFNLQVLPRLYATKADILLGIDWDGWLYSQTHRKSHLKSPFLMTTPYWVCIKGVLADEARFEKGFTRRFLMFQSHLERLNLRSADGILTTSLYSRRRINELYGISRTKIRVVPEGIDLVLWSKLLKETKSSSQRNGKRGDKGATIVCVAKQYPRKRISLLLLAVHQLKKEFPKLRLRIIGDGPEHSHLAKLARTLDLESSLLGAIPRTEDVAAEYAKADLFCLPSAQEGFGIVFLEAMAAGLPIVAARAAAVPEVVHHGKTGLLFRSDDLADLTRCLRHLISSKDLRIKMGRAGRQVVRHYDWKHVGKEYLRALRSSTSSTSPSPKIRKASRLGR